MNILKNRALLLELLALDVKGFVDDVNAEIWNPAGSPNPQWNKDTSVIRFFLINLISFCVKFRFEVGLIFSYCST